MSAWAVYSAPDSYMDRRGPGVMDQAETVSLDVGSKWWYWILGYVVATIAVIPVSLIALAVIIGSVLLLGSGANDISPFLIAPAVVFGAGLLIGSLLMFTVVFLVLPIALYLDARSIVDAGVDWQPDPALYALVAVLQFVISPLIGLVISIYYLYRRHQAVGVP